jgi:hypothetical protein
MAGLIAGALRGAADAVGDIAEGHIRDERELNLAEARSKIEEQRQLRIEAARQKMGLETRQAEFDQDEKNAPRRTASAIADARAKGIVKTEMDIEDAKKRGADPEYLKAEKAKANASRPDAQYAPGTYAEAQLKQMLVDDEKRRRQLLDQRAEIEQAPSMRGDQRERAIKRIDRELEVLNSGKKKSDETDTVKRTKEEYSYDEAGNKTGVDRLESIEKRRAPPPSQRTPKEAPSASKEVRPLPATAKELESGKVYSTQFGPARWNGSAFEKL